jgi:hypothetical protein
MGDDERKDTARTGPLVPASRRSPTVRREGQLQSARRLLALWRWGRLPSAPWPSARPRWAVESRESERTQRTGGRLGDRTADHQRTDDRTGALSRLTAMVKVHA